MKAIKFLLAALPIVAMTSCSDDLELAPVEKAPVAIEGVSFQLLDNAATRAHFAPSGAIALDKGDLLTLYNGGTVSSNEISGVKNAIYTYEKLNGVSTLTTPSMIYAGTAVMVYPSDTTFRFEAHNNKLCVNIPAVQDEKKATDSIPYISNGINVTNYVADNGIKNATGTYDNTHSSAGYNRTYSIGLKAMASILTLNADYTTLSESEYEKVEKLLADKKISYGIKLDDVTLNRTEGFNTSLKVTFDKSIEKVNAFTTGKIGQNWPNDLGTVSNPSTSWTYFASVDTTTANVVATSPSLKSTHGSLGDASGNANSIKFLFLPQGWVENDEYDKTKTNVVIETNYGTVTIPSKIGPDDYKVWYRKYDNKVYSDTISDKLWPNQTGWTANTKHRTWDSYNDKITVAEGMNYMMKNSFIADGSGYFVNEPVGGPTTRWIDVDLTRLNMNTLHIKDDEHLYNAVQVWDALGLGTVTVYLDSKGLDDKFEIKNRTIAKINEINKQYYNTANDTWSKKFQVKVCQKETTGNKHSVDVIKVVDGGEVPDEMRFVVEKRWILELADETTPWTWSNPAVHNFGEKLLEIVNNGTLNVNETASAMKIDNAAYASTINGYGLVSGQSSIRSANRAMQTLTNNKTINVNTSSDVFFNVDNFGTINIAENKTFRIADKKMIVNRPGTIHDVAWPVDADATKAADWGKVYVNANATFSAVGTGNNADAGVIKNYGYIKNEAGAVTLVTENQTAGADFVTDFNGTCQVVTDASSNKAFTAVNAFGVIDMAVATDNVAVTHSDQTGFIKWIFEGKEGETTRFTKPAGTLKETKFNYLVVKNDIQFAPADEDPSAYISFTDKVKWMEIAGENVYVFNLPHDGSLKSGYLHELQGLIVPNGKKLSVDITNTLYTAKGGYVAGKIDLGGTLWLGPTENKPVIGKYLVGEGNNVITNVNNNGGSAALNK